MLVFKIAWRNILRHKGKSIIIGSILFLGALIMTLGNATAIGMQKGVEQNIVRSFTGHIILVSDQETKDNVLFTPMAKPLKILRDYDRISAVLRQQDYVKDFIPMTRGGVAILGGSGMNFLLTFGCNFDDFQRVFGSPVEAVEGQLLTNGDHGLLVNEKSRQNQHKMQGYWLVPAGYDLDKDNLSKEARADLPGLPTRSTLALGGFGESNSTDMELPIRAITRFKSLNNLMQEISIMDIESFRQIFGYYTAADVVQELPPEQEALLASGEEDLFGSADIFASGSSTTSTVTELEKTIHAEARPSAKINYDNAAYNYVSVILKPGEDLGAAVARTRELMKDNGLPVKVLSWKQASGQVAQISDILRVVINVFVILLFFVAVIIIMNTLSMTALERTEEFGMMRAVGARKGFITRMFLSETLALSAIFGGAGILIGALVAWIFQPLGISSGESEILELLFGGKVFQPTLGVGGVVGGIVALGVVTVLAVLYPLFVARRITPLDAINRH
jgi:ABC-type lipoprotein release transport system permease subunit